MKKVVAIYHKDCSDGTTAAAVVLKKFPDAHVFPLSHSYTKDDTALILAILDSETEIYTIDCGLGLKEILPLGYKVTTLDHHIGIKEEFENLAKDNPNFTYVFDNNKSGASLSWSYFFPDEQMPELIKYVEDFDLHILKYKNTYNVLAYVSMFENKPEKMLEIMSHDLTEIINKGQVITDYIYVAVEKEKNVKPVMLKIGKYEVPGFNITGEGIKSHLTHALYKKFGRTVVVFKIEGDKVKYSFRCDDNHTPSALEIASQIGGGGHRNASGAATTIKQFLEMIIQ